jgi:hypothetical protein
MEECVEVSQRHRERICYTEQVGPALKPALVERDAIEPYFCFINKH